MTTAVTPGSVRTGGPEQDPGSPDWPTEITAVLADPGQPRLVFQPIVDLRRGTVAGYEALARFPGPPFAAPDVWFAAADRLGVGAALEARVLRAALVARDDLPADCFLTVNLSPHLVAQPEIAGPLLAATDLSRLVLELTEHVAVADFDALTTVLDHCRRAGATVALDDAGSGWSGLQQLAVIRPEIVKIDRVLVDHVDRDEVKLALAELLGAYASRLDAVLLAEGIEREQELEVFARLGVPLAQGWLFGRPGPGWGELPTGLGAHIRELARQRADIDRVGGLVESIETVGEDDLASLVPMFTADPELEVVAAVDRHGRAVCLLRRGTRTDDGPADVQLLPVSLRVTASADVATVAGRAMTRPTDTRFDPVVCSDDDGNFVGIVRPERLTLHLAGLKSTPDRPMSVSAGSSSVGPGTDRATGEPR